MQPLRLLSTLLLCLSLGVGSARAASAEEFDQGLGLLLERGFQAKGRGVDLLAQSGDTRAVSILAALLEGQLFSRRSDGRLVVAEKQGGSYAVRDALSGEALGLVDKKQLSKITVNNSLRTRIRSQMALLDLSHPDSARRLGAANRLLQRGEAGSNSQLQDLLDVETDLRVREVLRTAIALGELGSDDSASQLGAIEVLAGNLHPTVRIALSRAAGSASDAAVGEAARGALRQMDFKIQLSAWVETAFFGLSLGSVLVLAAIGLAITFGVMGVINMAHGELIMLGAYTTYLIQQLLPGHIGVAIIIAIPAAFLVSGMMGIVIERGVIRFLYGRPLETLLATFGISLILQQAVRSVFSPLNRSVATPEWMSGSMEINSVLSLTLNRMYILLFCLLVFAALFLVLKRTTLGLQVRAVSQNRAMARAMGVRSARVDALTFGLGSGIAGVAGVALSQLTNVGPNLGQAYIIDSFMVVVFGGVGNLWGTLVGGLSLGVANKFLEPWAGAVLAKIVILAAIILFIQKRPRGLFPQKGRAVEG